MAMTEDKARKRAIRTRMAKTGERYTAARHHVVKPGEQLDSGVLPHTDEAVRRNTGKGWNEWLDILDRWGARHRTHGDIARMVMEEHRVSGWWAQAVALGYERARGMRAKHQRVSTGFTVSVSKTFNVGIGRVYAAFTEPRRRSTWLERGTLRMRTARKGKSARFDYGDGSSRVNAYFESKGRAKTTVTVEHERLPDAAAVEEMRVAWRGRLSRLAEALG
jgi:hypothetical protein